MAINRWTNEEIDYLINNYYSTPSDELIKNLKEINPKGFRNELSIRNKANQLGLKKDKNYLKECRNRYKGEFLDRGSIKYLDIKNGFKYNLEKE